MFSGRKSARAGAPVGVPFAASASGRTGVEVFSGKTGKPRAVISGHVADFARGKSEFAAVTFELDWPFHRAMPNEFRLRRCSGGRAARNLVGSAADTATSTEEKKLQRAAAATELVDSIRSETRRFRARRLVTRRCRRGKYSVRRCECWQRFGDTCCAEDRIYHPRSIARGATDPTGRCCAAGNDNSRSRASSLRALAAAPQSQPNRKAS